MLAMTVDWHAFFFWMFALFTCGFAVGVVFTGNIVRMAFYLTLSLGASAGLFFLAGAEFVGAMQLMIYVGGTLVLLIFGVMLTAQARFISLKTPPGEWILALFVGGSLLFLLLTAAFNVEDWRTPHPDRASVSLAESKATTQIGAAFTGVRLDKLTGPAGPHETGLNQTGPNQTGRSATLRGGMSGYLLPFVIVSIHLLVVLIGAAYMARTKRRAAVSGIAG